MSRYLMALDQGTTSSRAILFDREGALVAVDQHEFPQHFPKPGWVEHDPAEIWESQLRAGRGVLAKAGIRGSEVAALGITNQRETTVIWDRRSGAPIHRAIVWQSRQSAPICEALRARGLAEEVSTRTGLVIDAYFSGTKIRFILDAVPGAQQRAGQGELAFGTVDSWLLRQLTRGRVHATEYSNAARTLIFNIHSLDWDDLLLRELRIPRAMLPEVRPSSGVFGVCDPEWFGAEIPIAGIAGDQQAALFGQGCVTPGTSKNTYGTGCFMLMHTGAKPVLSKAGLITTVACGARGEAAYALEGSVFIAGAAIQWLRDGLGFMKAAAESGALAQSVDDAGGVVLVPAFVGLGAPYWRSDVRGALFGITRGTTRAHVVRAALESLAFQSRDLVEAMARDAKRRVTRLRVDGGAAANDFLMQYQADLLGVPVERPRVVETTALGAGLLAGLGVGFWSSHREADRARRVERVFKPQRPRAWREAEYARWKKAVGMLLEA
jgi:glycerol kinase